MKNEPSFGKFVAKILFTVILIGSLNLIHHAFDGVYLQWDTLYIMMVVIGMAKVFPED